MIDNITIANVPPTPPVGIEGLFAPQFTVYPNPTTGRVNIQTEREIQRIDVLDMMGRRVFSSTHGNVDLSPLPDGIYLLRCTSANSTTGQRIIKRK